MQTLSREHRKLLEEAVKQARRVAEEGAGKALAQLAVGNHEPWGHMSPEQRNLRRRLRAHGRQLGDIRDNARGTQETVRLSRECAYAHWHRMLFARFLAEADLLIEPTTGVAISIGDAKELARERGSDWVVMAGSFAEKMLPQIFRQGDPVLEVTLPPETRSQLEDLLDELPRDVFLSDDGLGWVYQFWQAERKDEVNRSEVKIGADELPAVTQLFTEDYMVLFLLHNTLGAWWAGKVLAQRRDLAVNARDEQELREACRVADIEWTYLRFVREASEDGTDGPWRPAAGTHDGWPKIAKEITVLDPCMGSGHFLVFALPILVAFRMAEERLSKEAAVDAVLRDNLFGLEIDQRCTQIAAFNLALAAWRRAGHCTLPPMNLACSGLAPNAGEADWLAIAGDNEKLRNGMGRLYRLFKDAPMLGSLVNPRLSAGDMFIADYHELQPLLEKAMAQESKDDSAYEMAVTARGLAKAAEILAGQFTLVATNVPYLGRGKQDELLQDYCNRVHPDGKADLATCFVERSLNFCAESGSTALVTPQNWLFLTSYRKLREKLLRRHTWNFVARLGNGAFETIGGHVVNVSFIQVATGIPSRDSLLAGIDASGAPTPAAKRAVLMGVPGNMRITASSASGNPTKIPRRGTKSSPANNGGPHEDLTESNEAADTVGEQDAEMADGVLRLVSQAEQLGRKSRVIRLRSGRPMASLGDFAGCFQGISSGDNPRLTACYWEMQIPSTGWRFLQGPTAKTALFAGREHVIRSTAIESNELGAIRGREAWAKQGICLSQVGRLLPTLYTGEYYSNTVTAIIPHNPEDLAALWQFAASGQLEQAARVDNAKVAVDNGYFARIEVDVEELRGAVIGADAFTRPYSADPTQWLFIGNPRGSDHPLHVAVARLVGYRWPRQAGSSFVDCPVLDSDGLEPHADRDGIVCLSALKGEPSANERLVALLSDAYGSEWSAAKLADLLAEAGFAGKSLDDWLRDGFFEQHCALFHQRPFIWHVWDGMRDGFHALVNYHRLAGPGAEGRRTVEKLAFTYLGGWLDRQSSEQRAGVDGADGRLAAAQHLQAQLKLILEGEPPYDIFVRWKPLHEQAIGWEPDINDGVRMNIRPFMAARPLVARARDGCILRTTPKQIKWEKDRGREPSRSRDDYPWFWGWDESAQDFAGGAEFDGARWNNLHYTKEFKQRTRGRHTMTVLAQR